MAPEPPASPWQDGAATHRQELARETTPERARRKMKDDVRKSRAQAAKEKKPIFMVVNTGNCLGFV